VQGATGQRIGATDERAECRRGTVACGNPTGELVTEHHRTVVGGQSVGDLAGVGLQGTLLELADVFAADAAEHSLH
jgi:hypothetical protein